MISYTSGTCAQAHTRMTEKEVEEVEAEVKEEEEGGGCTRGVWTFVWTLVWTCVWRKKGF